MQPSLWSGFFGSLTPEGAMQELAAAGFGHAEIACETALDPQTSYFSDRWMRRLRLGAASSGIVTPQLHYPIATLNRRVKVGPEYDPEGEADLAHPQEWRRRYELQCATDLIKLCPTAGVKIIVMHPGGSRGLRDSTDLELARQMNVEAFSHLAPIAAAHGVTLALENMGRAGTHRQFGSRIAELAEVLQTVQAPNLGVCLDTSHARLMGEDIPAAIEVLGSKLVATHISDNLESHDDHLLPYSGRIEWQPVVAALKRVGYGGLLNLEIPGESNCPLPILRLKARHALRLLETMESPEPPARAAP